jgi:hypothetical protein
MWGLLMALSLTPSETVQHRLYLANGYFFEGDIAAAKAELMAARQIDPSAELSCRGVTIRVQIAGLKMNVCDIARAQLPAPVDEAVRRAVLARDMTTARKLDPFRFRKVRARLHAAR